MTAAAAAAGVPDTEALLAAAPDLLVQGGADGLSLRQNVARHPLVRRYWEGDRMVVISQAAYLCGTPFVADAALRLRRQLRSARAAVRTRLPFAPTVAR